jgi:hypothetical protein
LWCKFVHGGGRIEGSLITAGGFISSLQHSEEL